MLKRTSQKLRFQNMSMSSEKAVSKNAVFCRQSHSEPTTFIALATTLSTQPSSAALPYLPASKAWAMTVLANAQSYHKSSSVHHPISKELAIGHSPTLLCAKSRFQLASKSSESSASSHVFTLRTSHLAHPPFSKNSLPKPSPSTLQPSPVTRAPSAKSQSPTLSHSSVPDASAGARPCPKSPSIPHPN